MTEDPDDDWLVKWKKARNGAIPYGIAGFGLEFATILSFAFVSFWYGILPFQIPWWSFFPLAFAGVPFLIYFFILVGRANKIIPPPDFEEKTEEG
jgi:hypothetical protein